MKYIDADKLIAEIERWRDKAKFHQNADSYYLGIIDGLDMAERILDTLPDEPETDCHDLEEEIDRFEDWMETYDQADYPTSFTTRDIARHFAEWGAEHLRDSTKKISEDLEEATEGEWIWATTPPEKPGKYKVPLRYDTYSAIWNGVKWIDDASGFPIMGVFKWKPIKEEQQ